MSEDAEFEVELVDPPAENLLATIESALSALPEDAPTDGILAVREQLLFYKNEAARMLKLIEDRMIARIKRDGAIEYGNGVRFYLSFPKTTKCVALKEAINAIGEATAGDENLFLGCFSTNALKHGAAKKILPAEKYEKLFKTTVKDKLEGGEPAPKRLTKLDEKFMR